MRPRGTLDYFGQSADALRSCIRVVEDVFVHNGGRYLETPVFENKETLMAKYGEEAESKLVYYVQENGGHALALRYDHTVPMTRFITDHGIKKLRRYTIGKVYRRDTPNALHGRFREFYQADFDVIGEESTHGSAELLMLSMVRDVFDRLGYGEKVVILANCTSHLRDVIIDRVGVAPELFKAVCATVDKLDGMDFDELRPELAAKGLSDLQIKHLQQELRLPVTTPEWATLLGAYGLDSVVQWTPTLARGLDYYDGLIFEAKVRNVDVSLAAGGRYDSMLGIPAIGFSVGLTRIVALLPIEEPLHGWREEYLLTTVGHVTPESKARAIAFCKKIAHPAPFTWSLGPNKKLQRALANAAQRGIRHVFILGEDEVRRGCVLHRDLKDGMERVLALTAGVTKSIGNITRSSEDSQSV